MMKLGNVRNSEVKLGHVGTPGRGLYSPSMDFHYIGDINGLYLTVPKPVEVRYVHQQCPAQHDIASLTARLTKLELENSSSSKKVITQEKLEEKMPHDDDGMSSLSKAPQKQAISEQVAPRSEEDLMEMIVQLRSSLEEERSESLRKDQLLQQKDQSIGQQAKTIEIQTKHISDLRTEVQDLRHDKLDLRKKIATYDILKEQFDSIVGIEEVPKNCEDGYDSQLSGAESVSSFELIDN